MTEKALHNLIFKTFRQGKDVVTGPGDDCAVIELGGKELFLLAVDQIVSDIHFKKKNTPPLLIATKLINRNLSDIAAMGGKPAHALLAISVKAAEQNWFQSFFRSLEKEARKWNVSICGGDISSNKSDDMVLSLTITGKVQRKKLCLRSAARAGDRLYATGSFGNSFHSGHHLKFIPRLKEAAFLAGRFTRAMMDVSDGLLLDSVRMAEASRLGLVLHTEKIPLRRGAKLVNALSEGEDYELIFAVPSSKSEALERNWPFSDVKLSCIGEFTARNKGRVFDSRGKDLSGIRKAGFDHFV